MNSGGEPFSSEISEIIHPETFRHVYMTSLRWGGGEGRAIVDTHNLCAVRTCSITLFNKNVGPLASSHLTTTKTKNTSCSHVTNLARIIMANGTNQQKAMNFLLHV